MWTLKGIKTYIVGFLAIIATGCSGLGYIDAGTYKVIMGLLGGLGVMALRAGINKVE